VSCVIEISSKPINEIKLAERSGIDRLAAAFCDGLEMIDLIDDAGPFAIAAASDFRVLEFSLAGRWNAG
jgi:hypothetical protein